MNLTRVAAVASKEWRETTRDRLFLSLVFILPLLWMVVFGYGVVLDVEHIPMAALDRDGSRLSRDYFSRFTESRYFDFKGFLRSEEEADHLLQRGSIRMAIIVPEKFQERLLSGFSVGVQTLIDGTFPMRTEITKGYVVAVNNAFSEELLVDHLAGSRGIDRQEAREVIRPIRLEVRYLYNQEVKSTWAMAPALVMFSLMVSVPLLTALGVVREKERGSIYNIYSSTVSRGEFLVGKLSPYIAMSGVNVVLLWIIATRLFEVPFKGNFVFFFVSSLVFVACCTGIGLVVSLLVNTQMAAMIIAIIVGIVPTFLFSGFIVPVSSLSPGAQIQSRFVPARYYTDIVRGGFLKGLGMDVYGWELLALAGYASALFLLGYVLFRKRPRT